MLMTMTVLTTMARTKQRWYCCPHTMALTKAEMAGIDPFVHPPGPSFRSAAARRQAGAAVEDGIWRRGEGGRNREGEGDGCVHSKSKVGEK